MKKSKIIILPNPNIPKETAEKAERAVRKLFETKKNQNQSN